MEVAAENVQETSAESQVSTENTQTSEASNEQTAENSSIESFIESKQATKATDAPGSEATTAPAYTPNYKYKVKDQEREFPDYIRAAIKDEATEKSVRDLMTRVDGLDEVKASREALQKQYQQIEPAYKQLNSHYAELVHHWQAAGVDTQSGKIQNVPALEAAFNKLGLNDNVLFQYVHAKLNTPQEALPSYQFANSLQAQNYQLQQERDALRQEFQSVQLQQAESQLNQLMSTPDATTAANYFGGTDKLRDEIIMRGRVYQAQGVHKAPQEIAEEVMRPFKGLAQLPATQPNTTPQTPVVAASKPAVIPVLKGGGASVVKPKVKSIADIEKLAESL